MDDQEIDLRSILGLLRRQLRLIIITFVLVMAVATVAVFSLKPAYTASTLVLVDPSRKDLLDPEQAATSSSSDSARIDSEVEIVKSETTMLHVIDDAGLLTDPLFAPKLGIRDQLMALFRIGTPKLPTGADALNDVLGKLNNAVSVQRRGLTYLLVISAQAGNAETAAKVSNAVASAYIKSQVDSKIASILASRDIIEARIVDANKAVAESEGAFDTFISDNIGRITSETGQTDIVQLRRELEAANADKLRLAGVIDKADTSLQQQDFAALANSLQSQALQSLEDQRKTLETSLAGAAEGSQTAIDLKAELAKIQTNLSDTAQTELTTLKTQVTTAQTEASDLRTKLRTTVLNSDLPPDILTNIYALQQTSEIARTQYQTLISRSKDLEGQAYLQVADSRVVSAATPPAQPSFPNPRLIIGLAAVVALGLGVGLAFLVENFVGGFTSEEQLRSVLRANMVAAIPQQKLLRKSGEPEPLSPADTVISSPLSIFSEGVRRVRLGIDQLLRRKGQVAGQGAVIMVTSAAPNEGKSTTSVSLARAYSMSGRTVLLIDCDLRKPSIHRQLGIDSSSGLLDYLLGKGAEIDLTSILKTDPQSSVNVAVGARHSEVATDQLLAGQAFSRLIAAARRSFDIVILDTPPIGPVVDGLYLAQFPDAIVFVTRWASTSQSDARSALQAVENAKPADVPILSVLTQQEISAAVYRGRYAGYYARD